MITGTCKKGHILDEQNLYESPSGKSICRKCQAETRRLKRHAIGESKTTRRPRLHAERIIPASLQAFRALDRQSASLTREMRDAYQALGDALGWPNLEMQP